MFGYATPDKGSLYFIGRFILLFGPGPKITNHNAPLKYDISNVECIARIDAVHMVKDVIVIYRMHETILISIFT